MIRIGLTEKASTEKCVDENGAGRFYCASMDRAVEILIQAINAGSMEELVEQRWCGLFYVVVVLCFLVVLPAPCQED